MQDVILLTFVLCVTMRASITLNMNFFELSARTNIGKLLSCTSNDIFHVLLSNLMMYVNPI